VSRRPASAVAIVVALATLAACTSEQQSMPPDAPAPTTAAPTIATTAATTVASTTTSTPATSAAPPTTEPPVTTAVPPTTTPAGPAATSIPLIVGGESDGWLLLGAWQVDEWQSAFSDDGSPIETDLTGNGANPIFTVSALDLPETDARLGPSVPACETPDLDGPTVDIELPAPEPPGFGYGAIAMPAAGRVLKPRPIAVLTGAGEVYQGLGEAAFAEVSVDATKGSIVQLVVTDVDGDGDDEAIAVFEFVQPGPTGTPGDLAAVLLIDTDTRAATTLVGSFIADADDDDTTFDVIEQYRILDIVDLNGDGRMEILIRSWYSEGAGVDMFTYDGTDTDLELSTGCGS